MKNFFTSMLGALVALCIFTFCGFLLFLGILGAMISLGARKTAATTEIAKGSYLVFDLSTNIVDSPPAFDFRALLAKGDHEQRPGTLQLRTVVRAIHAAAGDSRIAGVLITGSLEPSGFGSGYAALREVRSALSAFRQSGKPIRAYLEEPSIKDYYLASIANEVDFNPYGTLFLPGLAAEPIYFAGAFEKYGVGIQVTRVGKYKSAVEALTRKDMSLEDRAQLHQLLGDIWQSVLEQMGASRGLAPAAIQATADTEGLIGAEAAKRSHLVDRVLYLDQLDDELKAATGGDGGSKNGFKQVSLSAYAQTMPQPFIRSSDRVAVVYAEGEIVDGEGEPDQVGGLKFAAELRKLREDRTVKAIVLRVNSPGGSVTASEAIQREVRLARQAKPVVVSMGTYAASGGYWISADSDRIFAEPTTVTGSIGVFGIQFDIQRLFADFGVTFDRVKIGKFSDSDTSTRPKTDEEMAVVQRQVDWFYGQFIEKVAAGRKLSRAQVEEIAQGRVWSGLEAKKQGLVDEMGGLSNAIQYAAKKAGLGASFRVTEFPGKQDLAQILADFFDRLPGQGAHARIPGLAGSLARRLEAELAAFRSFNDPQGLYARLPFDLDIR